MAFLLDTPNESLSNDVDLMDVGPIVNASSSNNAVTNTGVMWSTGSNQTALYFGALSSNATVTNTGYVRGGESALFFQGSGATIGNAGEMTGGTHGLFISGSAVAVSNVFGGTIKGGLSGIVFFADDASQINNDGIVYGAETGIILDAKLTNSGEVGGNLNGVLCAGSATIVNTDFGGIWSSGAAIEVRGGETAITNNAGCQITGSQAAIRTVDDLSGPGRISLTNLGTIDGVIDCNGTDGNVDDTIVNKGTITDRVELGAGNDIFNGAGGTSGEVYGEAGNDKLTGGAGDNALSGGEGLDILKGGRGKDELLGGADRDIFDFDSIKESVRGAKHDFIADFQRGLDDIDLRTIDAKTGAGNQAFKFIGTQAFHDVKGELHYKDLGASCLVQGDINGDGKADFEILVKAAALSSGDFLL